MTKILKGSIELRCASTVVLRLTQDRTLRSPRRHGNVPGLCRLVRGEIPGDIRLARVRVERPEADEEKNEQSIERLGSGGRASCETLEQSIESLGWCTLAALRGQLDRSSRGSSGSTIDLSFGATIVLVSAEPASTCGQAVVSDRECRSGRRRHARAKVLALEFVERETTRLVANASRFEQLERERRESIGVVLDAETTLGE